MNNITLIGMPGSGKSYVGNKLAKKLGYKFIELDSILEHEFKLPLQKILDKLGEDAFLNKQADDAIAYTNDKNNLLISTGGSIIYTGNAMEHLKNVSTIVYLKASLEIIKTRIDEDTRGVVGLGNKTLEELYDERSRLYEKYAEVTINADQEAEHVIKDAMIHLLNLKFNS